MVMAPPAEQGEAALSASSDAGVTVAERLQLKLAELTPAERKVARVLMAEYPVRGLQPVAKLAAAAGVSAPTVVRLVSKLSFDSCRPRAPCTPGGRPRTATC